MKKRNMYKLAVLSMLFGFHIASHNEVTDFEEHRAIFVKGPVVAFFNKTVACFVTTFKPVGGCIKGCKDGILSPAELIVREMGPQAALSPILWGLTAISMPITCPIGCLIALL